MVHEHPEGLNNPALEFVLEQMGTDLARSVRKQISNLRIRFSGRNEDVFQIEDYLHRMQQRTVGSTETPFPIDWLDEETLNQVEQELCV